MSSRATTAHAYADPNSAGSDAVLLRLVGMVQSLGEELRDVRQAQDKAAEQMEQVQQAQKTMEGELADIQNSQAQVQQAQDKAAEQMEQVQQAQKTMEGELADIQNSQAQVQQAQDKAAEQMEQVQQAQKTMEGELADIQNSQAQVQQAQDKAAEQMEQVQQAQKTMEGELADIQNSQAQVQQAQDKAAEQMEQVQQAQKTMEGELADIQNSQAQVQQAQEGMRKLLLEAQREAAEKFAELQQAQKRMEGQHATTLNEELAWTVCRNGNAVSVAEVNALLDRGADLYRYQLPRPFRAATAAPCRRPALHALIALGHLEAVEAVMAHPRVVDLTSVDELGCSPLHVLASACPGEDAKVADMLAAMLARDRDPSMKTVVDWAQEGACRDGQRLDFLSAAAAAGRLSLLLPELLAARVPHYNCRPNFTLELKVVPQAADWARLSDEHKRALAYYKVWEQQQQATADLVALLESCEWKPQSSAATLQRLRELARLGADVMHLVPSPPGWSVPASILTYFIRSGPMEVVECLLRTPHTLDFTVGNKYGSTPLHFVPYPWTGSTEKVSEEVRRLLHLLLDRIEQHPHEDVVDWGRKDNDGHAPISWAAAYGHLAPFVKVVFHERPVPYFTDHPGRITITSRGKSSDVKRLPEADRKRLHFTRDIDEKA
eukprot:gene9504-biopygen6720